MIASLVNVSKEVMELAEHIHDHRDKIKDREDLAIAIESWLDDHDLKVKQKPI